MLKYTGFLKAASWHNTKAANFSSRSSPSGFKSPPGENDYILICLMQLDSLSKVAWGDERGLNLHQPAIPCPPIN